jgi:hypothetical protein
LILSALPVPGAEAKLTRHSTLPRRILAASV